MPPTPPLWPRIASKLRGIAYYPLDVYDLVVGNRPPGALIFSGDGSWRAVGSEFLEYFGELGLLERRDHVLDVGSGIGRMALPLTRYLDKEGSYTGFDIVRSGVEWCQTNITPRHPNFMFFHSDVHNKHYNPSGKVKASEYVFPFDARQFDFVFLTSVFTHMMPADYESYLSEIGRVMKPGRRCLITFFIINPESKEGIQSGRSTFAFRELSSHCHTIDVDDPEVAIAFEEEYVRKSFGERDLNIVDPIYYGSWSGRRTRWSFQDIVVAVKEPSRPTRE